MGGPGGFHGYYGRFKRRGLRITQPRQVILEVLDSEGTYLSAEEVFMRVHQDNPGIGLATVYRTMSLLDEMGLVQKFEFGEGKARYKLTEKGQQAYHHHLLVCSSCFKVIRYADFSEEEKQLYADIETRLEELYDFSIKRHVVQYYGICAECRTGSGGEEVEE
jgi:Fur family ferric uptake transcriptional regulator